MADRPDLPDDSNLDRLEELIESGEAQIILGHIGERTDEGEWRSFNFEVLDADGEKTTVRIGEGDIGENDWMDIFDWIDDLCEENDVDYDNSYGETT